MGGTISIDALDRLIKGREQFLAYIQRRVESRAVAEDILQAAFVRGVERGGELRDSESVVSWFYRILRNAVIDYYRHKGVESRALEAWSEELAVQAQPTNANRTSICACITELFSDLKPEYQAALKYVELEEQTLKEFAKEAGITAGNAAVRVHRAREALVKQVRKTCGACAEHKCLDCNCHQRA
jgi:RNA polymerase sigma-70 factor (ECF subfamily)